MKIKSVGIITSRKWNIPTRCDRLLAKALLDKGVQAQILCWEDDHAWENYDLLILHSCWDYHLHYEEFCQWLDGLNSSGAHIANGITAIKENIDKVRQMTLLRDGDIPVIPFEVCSTAQEAISCFHKLFQDLAVIKPSVASSGYHTTLVRNEQELICSARAICEDRKRIIVQPYVETVRNGEISMIYYHGNFSHAVCRYPGVITEKRKPTPIIEPEPQWLRAAEAVNRMISAKERLYTRIDLVPYRGKIHVMEVELAEPDLYLDLAYSSVPSPLEQFIEEIHREMNCTILREQR